MNASVKYMAEIQRLVEKVSCEQTDSMERAASLIAEALCGEGYVFMFGTGHSHLLAEEIFYRAGGLANVSPMLDTDLMLHNGAAKSSRMEKMGGIAAEIFRRYTPSEKDMIFIFSASGKNQVPVEMAEAARKAGLRSVGVSSLAYADKGGRLHECVDIAIDCKVPYGDACLAVGEAKMGGLSTYTACFILNSCLINGAKLALEEGTVPPVYISGNVEGGRAHNVVLEDLYLGRVKHL
jgi:uncharacterized phosphosugar-binding protein